MPESREGCGQSECFICSCNRAVHTISRRCSVTRMYLVTAASRRTLEFKLRCRRRWSRAAIFRITVTRALEQVLKMIRMENRFRCCTRCLQTIQVLSKRQRDLALPGICLARSLCGPLAKNLLHLSCLLGYSSLSISLGLHSLGKSTISRIS